ncbi:GumC family protein [Phenylobacterium sp. J367]|uniref:GumC family protein n=1 Tax=Phenylobacterium sp. J367 TaxID=2898435 RepID=UPI00215145C9|nr:GumC family protein [Phenylobacterium sp. J367]MCR5879513.1 GumC family protein [Phenylobacterium sp. J367]
MDRPAFSGAEGFGRIDPRRLLNAFRRRIRLFSAIVVLVFLGAVLLTLSATPKYTATASVMLDPRKETITSQEAVLSGLPADSSTVDTEVEILKSRQLAGRVVRALKLDEDPEFNGALRKPEGLRAVTAGLKGLVSGATPPRKLTPADLQRQQDSVIDAALAGIEVRRAGLTYVIRINYEAQSPGRAAEIANKWAELYLLEQLEAKFDATQQASNWLNGRLGELRAQVIADEAAVQQFKIANNLLSASGTSLTEQEISSYNMTLAQARAQVAEDEARLATARRQLAGGSSGDDVGEALSSPVIQSLRAQRAQVSGQVADLQGRYGDRHPEMLKAKRQLSDIDTQIEQEISRIISNLEARASVSRQRAGALAGSLGGAKGTLAANNRAMVRLNELQRTAEASKTLYESYLNRYKETSTQQGIEQSDARVVSKAKIPGGPSSPRVPPEPRARPRAGARPGCRGGVRRRDAGRRPDDRRRRRAPAGHPLFGRGAAARVGGRRRVDLPRSISSSPSRSPASRKRSAISKRPCSIHAWARPCRWWPSPPPCPAKARRRPRSASAARRPCRAPG